MAREYKTKREKVIFKPEWCKHCGLCSAFCPQQAIGVDSGHKPFLAHPEKCNSCGLCERLCPDFVITVPSHKSKVHRQRKTTQ